MTIYPAKVAVASLALVFINGLLVISAGAAQVIVCPPDIEWNQIQVASPPGWIGLYRPSTKVRLHAARVWLGPLDQVPAELIGETEQQKNGSIVNRFPLEASPLVDGAPVRMEKWLVCTYGDESILRAIKLSAKTKECSVTYAPSGKDPVTDKPQYRIASITCR